jgi:hypothetical protein
MRLANWQIYRLGWLTYEDCNEILPASYTHRAPCSWLEDT